MGLNRTNRDEQSGSSMVLINALSIAAIAVVLFAIAAVAVYIFQFGKYDVSSDPEKWGQLGDYLGGVINPAVGLATVILVVASIGIQRRELQASLAEMKAANHAAQRMSFEQSLFAWLGNYHGLIGTVQMNDESGRTALLRTYNQQVRLEAVVNHQRPRDTPESAALHAAVIRKYAQSIPATEEDLDERDALVQDALTLYMSIYKFNRSYLDAPFRTLFRLLEWIDASTMTDAERWHYIHLVVAQLSWVEQAFLLYDMLGRNEGNVARLANKYAIFDNLDASEDFLISHIIASARFDRIHRCDPLTKLAFSSLEAKAKLGIP